MEQVYDAGVHEGGEAEPLSLPWTESLSGMDKAMALVMSLPPDDLARVLPYLPADLIALVMNEMQGAAPPAEDVWETIATEAHEALLVERGEAAMAMMQGASDLTLEGELVHDQYDTVEATSFLATLAPATLLTLLHDEHVPATAVVLASLEAPQRRAVLGLMKPDRRQALSLYLARMAAPHPRLIRRVEERLQHKWIAWQDASRAAGQPVGENGAVRFAFDELITLDGSALHRVLRGIPWREFTLALSGAAEHVRTHVLAHLSEQTASALRADLQAPASRPQQRVGVAQRKIVALVLHLVESGEIALG